jgi:cytochrome c553
MRGSLVRSSGRGAWLAAALLAALAPRFDGREVRAGDYHDGATLDCSQCHVMHATRGRGEGASLGAAASQRVGPLLRRDVNDLCLSCHDGSTRASDVLGRNQGRSPGDVRQAGSLNRLGRVGAPGTGHTLDSVDVAPGSSPPWRAEDENGAGHGLNCVNCHAPHGSAGGTPAYRNLRGDAGNNAPGEGLVTYNSDRAGANDPARDVFVRRALDYDESAVDFNEPDRRDSAMARFCAGCHDRFHGIPGADAEIGGRPHGTSLSAFVRHPASGVDVGAIGGEWSRIETFLGRANRVKVMSSTGAWGSRGGELTPTCISCHKAHGNDNAFGLIFRSGEGVLTEEGDGGGRSVEDLCRQCHGPAGALP